LSEYDNNNGMQDVCAVCRRTEDQAGKMIAMPNGMKVCTDCMNKMMEAASASTFKSDVGS